MTDRFILAATVATMMAPVAWSGVAYSDQLSPIVKACEENSACTYSAADPDGGMTFRIKRSSGVVAKVYCSAEGECERIYPRGQRASVDMIPSTIALR